MGEDMAKLKKRVHAIFSLYGIHIHATDIFGRNGLKEIEKASSRLSLEDRFVLNDLLLRINELKFRENMVEEEISKLAENDDKVKLLMTILGINVHSACTILAEIDDISRFPAKGKPASYAGPVLGQDQSGDRDMGGTYRSVVHQCWGHRGERCAQCNKIFEENGGQAPFTCQEDWEEQGNSCYSKDPFVEDIHNANKGRKVRWQR